MRSFLLLSPSVLELHLSLSLYAFVLGSVIRKFVGPDKKIGIDMARVTQVSTHVILEHVVELQLKKV